MKPKKTEIVDATIQLYTDLQEMTGLISRVIAKFPAETVPQRLKPFLGTPRVAFARPSMKGNGEILLQFERGGMLSHVQAQIPGEWLMMHQSELGAVVRRIYWGEKEERARRELARLEKSIGDHNRQAELHRVKAIHERQEYNRLAASIRKRVDRKNRAAGEGSNT